MNGLQKFKYQEVFWIFVILSSIFLLVAAILYLNTLLFLIKTKSVIGTVIELVPNPNHKVTSGGYGLAPKVVFWEETRERRFEFISSESSYPPAYNEDERITVYYDPENPENAKIGDFINLFAAPTFFFLISAFFFLCGFLLMRMKNLIYRYLQLIKGFLGL